MRRLAAFLLLLALAVAAPIDSHQQRQGLAQFLHNLNLGQLSNILSSSAVLQQTKTGSIISKQDFKELVQDFSSFERCINGNDFEIEVDSKSKMAWFSSSSPSDFSCDGGVLINRNGQWTLQHLNVTLPEKVFTSPKPKRAIEIKAMSFNLRNGVAADGDNSWYNRDHLVFNVFKDHNPDIFGVQEAHLFQIEEIQQSVPKYSWIGIGRESDGSGEFTAIFYDSEKFDLLGQDTLWFCDTPTVPGCKSYGNSIPRIFTWGKFIEKSSSTTFFFYNTHLDHQSVPSREKSAQQLVNHIHGIGGTEPVIVTGDFNNGAESSNEIKTMLNGGFEDSFRVLYPNATNVGTFNGFIGTTTGTKIDFVFTPRSEIVGGPSKVVAAEIVHDNDNGQYPSDHFPVTAIVLI